MSPCSQTRPRVSKSCANCRAVKRRSFLVASLLIYVSPQCDKQVPHCGQCIRTHDACAGYRDEWDLHFRDQTSQTITRVKEKEASAKAISTPPPVRSPIPSIDDIGVSYFVNNFVAGGHSSARGHLNYVSTIYRSNERHPTLVASMAAVGLVALANSAQQPGLVSHARAKYSEAIQQVNFALMSPTESLKDDILMSVISLGVFENVSNFPSWARHVQGAAALVVARGKSQFTNTAAILMFNQVRADMVVACIHDHKPFPEDLRELQEEAVKHTAASGAFWLLGVLASRHVNLLWKVRQNDPRINWTALLEEATALQLDFERLLGALAIEEPYSTIREPGADPEIIYNGRYDLYPSSWAIRVWNNARMLQMIVCNIIYFLLTKSLTMNLTPVLRTHATLRLQQTLQIQSKLENDMLATVPQALGYIPSSPQSHVAIGHSSPANVSGSYLLTWCLYTVGQSTVVQSPTRQWVIRRMREIGQNTGISVALQLLEDIVKLDELQQAVNDDKPRGVVDVLDIREKARRLPEEQWA
ncbi:hypothetical protein N7452_006925 [Penicillium brevicompactum]|uniref:Zn(2)-C6 fungal-type domain-containing protein n=1 Tax=Penicillium brevicompactum TaxID=5074 RepID=A0A9W9QEF4_PENBR|nr:hypothetical protein N7452_006925 [Penicillium brevicompactum]